MVARHVGQVIAHRASEVLLLPRQLAVVADREVHEFLRTFWIDAVGHDGQVGVAHRRPFGRDEDLQVGASTYRAEGVRSDERRVGKECVWTWRYWGCDSH